MPTEWLHPDDSPRILRAYESLIDEGRLTSEYRFRKKDGSYCWVSDELRVLRDTDGSPVPIRRWQAQGAKAQARYARANQAVSGPHPEAMWLPPKHITPAQLRVGSCTVGSFRNFTNPAAALPNSPASTAARASR